jgi:hypothetical protein
MTAYVLSTLTTQPTAVVARMVRTASSMVRWAACLMT